MEISTKEIEPTGYEPFDKEPYHYFAMCKGATGGWSVQYVFPMTDKQALINFITNNITYYDTTAEARIMKVRLPLG